MSKSNILLLAAALVLAGVSVLSGHPAWGTPAAIAFIFLGAATAAGATRIRAKRHKEKSKGQRVSNNLVALGATAILAVYGTGFHRTRAAADAFAARAAARRRPSARIPVAMAPAEAAPLATPPPPVTTIAAVTPPPASSPSTPKEDRSRQTPSPVLSATPSSSKTDAPKPVLAGSLSSAPAITSANSPANSPAAPATPPPPTPAAVPTAAPVAAVAAPTPPVAAAASDAVMPKVHLKDGTFLGWGKSAHGNIQASIVIQNGRIASAVISKCQTAYSCSWIEALPGQVVGRQDSNVDVVSGASDSSYAFQDAIAAAMFRGQGGG